MSFANPAFVIRRRTVEQPAREAGMWEKMSPMFPAATASPPTPDFVALTPAAPDVVNPMALPPGVRANPVPHVMAAAGFQSQVSVPFTVQRDLMHGAQIDTWDRSPHGLTFFLF